MLLYYCYCTWLSKWQSQTHTHAESIVWQYCDQFVFLGRLFV